MTHPAYFSRYPTIRFERDADGILTMARPAARRRDTRIHVIQPLTIVESAAIMMYLAGRAGRFLASDPVARVRCLERLMFQAPGLGPMFGQSGYVLKLAPEPIPAAIGRFHAEARRNLRVLDGRLAEAEWLAGDEISIADMAPFGWIWRRGFAGVDFSEAPHVERWFAAMSERPGVARALALFGG